MVEFAPSTGGLALWIDHRDAPAARDAPPALTDGATIVYGAAFEALPLAEQVGLVAHEVLHVALRHTQRYLDLRDLIGDVDLHLYTICADAIVNSTLQHLGWLRLPAGSVFLDELLAKALHVREDVTASLLLWDVERLYRAIDDRRESTTQIRRSGAEQRSDPNENQRRSDGRKDGARSAAARALGAHSRADLVPSATARGTHEESAAQERQWGERLLRGHASDGMFSMLRALIADVPRSRTPWQQVLRTHLARGLSRKPALSWSRPTRSYIANQGRCGANRRMPWEPGTSGMTVAPRLAVIVDVSGSIGDDMAQRFAREIEAIARRQEARLILVIGDERVRRVEVFEPGRAALNDIAFDGGGGTDFSPLLEGADAHRPDIAVVLTDLEGPALFRPHWPVIWAVPQSQAPAEPPFGRKLVLAD